LWSPGEANWLPASGAPLAGDQLVRLPEEDLRRQVPAQLSTEGTLDGDRLEGELIPARGHIAAAPLAGDHDAMPFGAGFRWDGIRNG